MLKITFILAESSYTGLSM